MDGRSQKHESVNRPTVGHLCIVMACSDAHEADTVSQQLSQLNMGFLVTYRRIENLMHNAPAGRVALVILATDDTPAVIRNALKWLRNRWPSCPITVVGDVGCGDHERTAREGGAYYLARPVRAEEWSAVLMHALGVYRKVDVRQTL